MGHFRMAGSTIFRLSNGLFLDRRKLQSALQRRLWSRTGILFYVVVFDPVVFTSRFLTLSPIGLQTALCYSAKR
jgi:hypothetical protein